MCYLCVARGVVGENYAATQRECSKGMTAWRRSCGTPPQGPPSKDLAALPGKSVRTWDTHQLKLWGARRHV